MSQSRSARRSPPKYCLHKSSGNARIRYNGEEIYFGKFDSPESREAYAKFLAEHWSPTYDQKPRVRHEGDLVTIKYLAVEYAKMAQQWYQKRGQPTSEWTIVQIVIRELLVAYGSMPAEEFGGVVFKNFRQTFIDGGLARTTINHYMFHVKAMFQLGVEDDRIEPQYYERLKDIKKLQRGKSKATEPLKVRPVDDAIVGATLKQLTPVVCDMVVIQWLTGMRPGELTQMRPMDIDRSSGDWFYRPESHKTEHHEQERVIVFGPPVQVVLTPYLLRDHQSYCFTPIEAYWQHYARLNEKRKTPPEVGNQATGKTKLKFRPRYTKDSYRHAIQRAALRAFPIPKEIKQDVEAVKKWKRKYAWRPNQLRHSAATKARAESGLEAAQQILGHASMATTEKYYAEKNLTLAVEFARNVDNKFAVGRG